METVIDSISVGKVASLWERRGQSAIDKKVSAGPHKIEPNGFVTDAQADLTNHGGRDKAIHHYPSDHYAKWIEEAAMPAGTVPAAFGENIASFGITEEMLCIGDVLRFGSALVQVSQGRQPCWKVSMFTGNRRMAALFQETKRTGWYYRVLETGTAEAGDQIALVDRLNPVWSIARVTSGLLNQDLSIAETRDVAALSELAEEWRRIFKQRSEAE